MKSAVIVSAVLLMLCYINPVFSSEHSLGIGGHYFKTLEEISDDLNDDYADAFHKDGIGLNLSYKYKPSIIYGFLCELQFFPDGYYFSESAISSRILFLMGSTVYVGAGIAWNYLSTEPAFEDLGGNSGEWTDAYYLVRAGFELPIVPRLKLDINANYELNQWSDLEDFDSDYISLGAGIRIVL